MSGELTTAAFAQAGCGQPGAGHQGPVRGAPDRPQRLHTDLGRSKKGGPFEPPFP